MHVGALHSCISARDKTQLQLQSYSLISTQHVPGGKPIDEIVLIPSLARALILSGMSLVLHFLTPSFTFPDRHIHFYAIPSFDLLPIKPIRNVVTFAVDDHHLRRPPASAAPAGVTPPIDAVDFCVIKRTGIALYALKDRLVYLRVCIF